MDQRLHNATVATLGSKPLTWARIQQGYAGYDRFRLELADGRSVFLKAAVNESTATWLRREWLAYEHACGPYMPVPLGFHDELYPVLFLEDLSGCFTAPPWNANKVVTVIAALDELADYDAPTELPALETQEWISGWDVVARDLAAFLSLGLCSPAWLERNLPYLIAASYSAPLAGSALVHADVRSDNIAFKDGQALFVDWSWASRGNELVDVVTWAPTLAAEGGPRPEDILPPGTPGVGEIAIVMAGLWASQAGTPAPTYAPKVRILQKKHLQVSLPWALRELEFEPLDGLS
jgi:hypothetical protein